MREGGMNSSRTARITEVDVIDIRFPTSRELDGSDAMNPDPDYSAAYTVLRTDAGDGLEGHGFAFTIGRGNEVQTAAIAALPVHVVAPTVPGFSSEMHPASIAAYRYPDGAFWAADLAGLADVAEEEKRTNQ
jgi:hypothetical protein